MRAYPDGAAYTASKAALNAFTQSPALELEPFGVRVRLVLPGSAPDTAFGRNAQSAMRAQGVRVPEPYAAFTQAVFARMAAPRGEPHTRGADVAEAVWRAVTDPAAPLRHPDGADAVAGAGAA